MSSETVTSNRVADTEPAQPLNPWEMAASGVEEVIAVAGAAAHTSAAPAEDDASSPSQAKKKPTRMRRAKYTPRACVECQQRKVKCSGEDTCRQCHNRNIPCVYIASGNDASRGKPRGKRKHSDEDGENARDDIRTRTKPNGTDRKLDAETLQERVRRLEEEIKAVTQAAIASTRQQYSPARSSEVMSPASSDQLNIPVHACDGQTDTFEAIVLQSQTVSLCSQLSSLRRLVGLGSIAMEAKDSSAPSEPGAMWELPSPKQLRNFLDVYFRDFDCYLPYLDQDDIERRLFSMLSILNYGEHNQRLFINPRYFPLAALCCNILAMGECYNPESTDSPGERQGWSMYLQGCRLIQRCSSVEDVDLDIVRYYAVGSGYLMHSECLRASAHAISLAIQLATKAKLNDQDAWLECSEEEVVIRKKLWWTIYFMDRRIAQKNGSAYLIRDSEVGVDDFSADGANSAIPQPNKRRNSSKSLRPLSSLDSDSRDYLQVLVHLGKLWGQIWDRFFAVTAPNLGDWQEIEIMDKRILFLQRHLPLHLTWDQEMASQYVNNGESEPQMRRRVLTYTRINTLRLIIRQNPLLERRDDLETKRFCASLATETITAIESFQNTQAFTPQSSGYFITASLVECICQLVPLLQVPCNAEERNAAVAAFRTAYRLLVQLSATLNAARRAIKALKNVFSVGEIVSFFKTLVAEAPEPTSHSTNSSPLPAPGSFDPLPLTIGALQWPSSLNFLPTVPTAGANDFTGQLSRPTAQGSGGAQNNMFDSLFFDLDGMSPGKPPGEFREEELDLNCDQFMYGDLTAEFFNCDG